MPNISNNFNVFVIIQKIYQFDLLQESTFFDKQKEGKYIFNSVESINVL